jgi:predicted N-acetyltransferase YhbS
MTARSFTLVPELPQHGPAIERLHGEALGPGRFVRAAARLREGVPHLPDLSFVALDGEELIASVRMTPIRVGDRPALLLGPLAVLPARKGQGAGRGLVRHAVEAARAAGQGVVMLVGDAPYYGPLGFRRLERHRIVLPWPVDPDRVLVAELSDGALDGFGGTARTIR